MPFLYAVFCSQFIPLWIFVVPLVLFLSLAYQCRRRHVAKQIFLVLAALVALAALPACAVQAPLDSDGQAALERRFGVAADAARVQSYRNRIVGLGDSVEFWKVKGLDSDTCRRLAAAYSLETQSSSSRPSSAPLWWPFSAKTFTIFKGYDAEGGSTEIWMPDKGSSAYLYQFHE